jgi:hypothetical protein
VRIHSVAPLQRCPTDNNVAATVRVSCDVSQGGLYPNSLAQPQLPLQCQLLATDVSRGRSKHLQQSSTVDLSKTVPRNLRHR